MKDLVIAAGFWGGFIVFFIVAFLRMRTVTVEGTLEGRHGHYGYKLGNQFGVEGLPGVFNGIVVSLPTYLPQLYLDNRKGQTVVGARYFIPQDQRIGLEGDFDGYFTFYAPKQYQILALSIITPDIMQTLINTAYKYDVEIWQDKLIISTGKHIYKKPAETEVIAIAQKIVSELEDKIQSWTPQDVADARSAILKIDETATVHMLGGRYRRARLIFGTLCAVLGALIWFIAVLGLMRLHDPSFLRVTQLILPASIFTVLSVYVVFGITKGWLRWFDWVLEKSAKYL